MYVAFGGLDTYCVCLPIVYLFMLGLEVMSKAGRSNRGLGHELA